MQTELKELLDRQRIADLIHSYAEAIDRRDQPLLASLFTPDAHLHYGAFDAPASVLVNSWKPGAPSPFIATHHLVGNIRIRFSGADRARAVTYLFAVHRSRYGESEPVDEMVRARYLDRLVKDGEHWRFAERTLVFDWSHVAPADKTSWWEASGGGALTGAHGAADPAHGFLCSEDS